MHACRSTLEDPTLSPKLIDLLVLLVERRGQTVDKEEIFRVVWPGVVVEEGGLARNVSLLRKALGEDEAASFIATVPKRGYRFVAPVREAVVDPPAEPRRPRLRLYLLAGVLVIIVALVVLMPRQPTTQAPAFRALTTNAAEQAVDAAAISPDGSYLAYYDLSGLYVRPGNSLESRRIELPANLLPTQLEWFPDKAHLLASAFDQEHGTWSAWNIPILGGAPKLLREDASYATVSPDGRQIAFLTKGNQIWLANADGGSPRVFVALPATERFGARLQFTADGAYLLNGRGMLNYSRPQIEARRLSDGAVTKLVDLPMFPIDFQLLPGGRLVVARVANDLASITVLERYDVDINHGASGTPVRLAEYSGAWAYGITATADGKRVTFVKDPAQSDVYVADLDASGDAISHVRRLTLDDARDRPTAWLGDSRHVVFHSNRNGAWGIYQQAIDEPAAALLVGGGFNAVWGSISPDQKSLLYMVDQELDVATEVRYDLVRQPLAGGPPETLSAGQKVTRRVRCPRNGDHCVLMENHGDDRVFFALDPERGIGAELARMPWGSTTTWLYDWDVAADGRIAVIEPAVLRDRITVFSFAGGHVSSTSLVVADHPFLQSLNWDAAGTGFYLSSTDGLAGELLHAGLDGHTTLLRRQVDGEGWAIPSPDGKHLAIQEWTIAGNVWELRL